MNYFNKNKIAIFSDIHIGVHHDSKFWHDVSLDWANWFVQELKQRDIRDVVFCGDYFHTRDEISVDSLHFGSKLLELFSDFNLTMIVGNHDCFLKDSSDVNSLSPFKNWKNVTVVDNMKTVKSHDKDINFVPWGIKLDEIPVADVTFGHFEIVMFKMNSFALCEEGFEAESLLMKSPTVFSGHFHLRDEKFYDNGRIIYVGNPFQTDYNDAGSTKGFYIWDIETDEFEFIENKKSPKHNNIQLSHLISEGGITQNVVDIFKNNLVKFKVDRKITSEDMEFILYKLRELNPTDLKIEYESIGCEYGLEEERKDFSGIDISQAIIEYIELMDMNNKEEIIQCAMEIFNKAKNDDARKF